MRKEVLNKNVREIMTKNPITVTPDMTVGELKRMFEAHDFNLFPVVDARGILCGLVTKLDLMLASPLRSLPVVERCPEGPVLVGVVSRTDILRCLIVQPDGA